MDSSGSIVQSEQISNNQLHQQPALIDTKSTQFTNLSLSTSNKALDESLQQQLKQQHQLQEFRQQFKGPQSQNKQSLQFHNSWLRQETYDLTSSNKFLPPKSIVIQSQENIILIEYIQKMPKVYEVHQRCGDYQPKQRINLGGQKQAGQLLENKGFYEGEWKDNKRCGFGSLIQIDKGFYQGYFKNDQFTYEGRLIDIHGQLMEGQWKNNQLQGIGIIKTQKYHYEGEVKDGEPNGEGKKQYKNYYYQGQFQRGMKHGKGKHTFNDGSEYEGNFHKNMIHGEGCYRFPDHKIYQGQFNDGEITGYGKMAWPNGQKYEGYFEKGLRHGFGQLIDQNRTKFEGQWIKNKQDGQFIRQYNGKSVEIVEYKEGVIQPN